MRGLVRRCRERWRCGLRSSATSLKIGLDAIERHRAAAVDDDDEFRRQSVQMTGPVFDGLCEGERVTAVDQVETGQRGYDCEPVRAFALRLGQALALQESEQAGIGLVAHAADLQVAAGGDVEMAVAEFPRCLGDRTRPSLP